MQIVVAVIALAVSCSNAEARGRRMMYQQPAYTQYYNTVTPTSTSVVPANTVVSQGTVVQSSTAAQTTTPAQTSGVVQAGGTSTGGAIVQTNAVAPSANVSTSNGSVVGSAQWKAEQSARMGSVQHIGGGFGGGSFEGNGFGATPEQAIQNSCYWGQRTPIQIGVARGANGYYATIFYR
jgi:hypothetical protein